jgi:hypothetical protein
MTTKFGATIWILAIALGGTFSGAAGVALSAPDARRDPSRYVGFTAFIGVLSMLAGTLVGLVVGAFVSLFRDDFVQPATPGYWRMRSLGWCIALVVCIAASFCIGWVMTEMIAGIGFAGGGL